MRSTFVPTLLAAFVAGTIGAPAVAATGSPTANIYLQRGNDGRPMLTDRPSPTALTERTWQMEREDPDVARQRALQVRREAEAVSERIRRRLEDQQRLAEARAWSREAQRERELQERLAAARAAEDAPTVVVPYDWRPRRPPGFEPMPPRRPPGAPRPGNRFREPASPESR